MLLSACSYADPRTIILTDATTITLRLPIMDQTAAGVQKELMAKATNASRMKPLYLVLNSPGGSIVAGKAIIETAKGLGVPVHTISMFSASMSFIISQYLDKRYVMGNTTMMSHRAFVDGLSGSIPGSLVSRALGLHLEVFEIDQHIADRAKIPVQRYESEAADEMWMTGTNAIQRGFADEMVQVRCDKTLDSNSEKQSVNIGPFDLDVVFHKCPLISNPVSVTLPGSKESAVDAYREAMADVYNHYHFYQEKRLQRRNK